MTLAYIGLGSNLSQPASQVQTALEELARLPRTKVVARSSLYRSKPVGFEQQPDFVNAVAALDTSLPATDLLAELQAVEARHGRERSFPGAPRTLDLDLLLYGNERIAIADLVVPHPRMHERAFVLKPLLEIAPAIVIRGIGAARERLAACADQSVARIA